MTLRRKLLVALAAPLGAAIVVMPAVAGSETSPTIEAVNSKGIYEVQHHYWQPSQATIAPGGAVTISNPTTVKHGVEWVGGPATPSCEPSVPVGSGEAHSGTQWSGSCTFTTAGVYTFYCPVHGSEMTGRITVSSAGTTTASTTPTEPPASGGGAGTTTPAGAPGAGAPQSGAGSSGAAAVSLAVRPHARAVSGSLNVVGALVGGRLQIDLLATHAALAATGGHALTRVGRLVRTSLPAGLLAFKVPLDRRAVHALHIHHRLLLSVRVTLTPTHGSQTTSTHRIVLRG